MSYRIQFTDSARFVASSLSNLVNNLAEGINKIKCKYGHDDKKCETCGCNENYQQKFDENLKKRFFNTYKFSNHGINKFI